MEKSLSIILPVYNVERYLERCIRSLEDQDIPHDTYEVIVINDGSPDNSLDVVLRLMKEFSNLQLIDKSNGGVSSARNAGIDRASGRYVLFVDPDDYILPNSLGISLESAQLSNAQVVFLGYQFYDLRDRLVAEVLNTDQKDVVVPGKTAYFLSRGNGEIDPDRAWAILYERRFVVSNELKFIPDVPYLEDGEFLARAMCLAERCAFGGKPFYVRTTRPGSATNSNLFVEEKSIRGFVKAAINLKAFQRQVNSTEHFVFMNQPIVKFTLLSIQACVSWSGLRYFLRTKRILEKEGLGELDLRGCITQYRRLGALYNLSPLVFLLYFSGRLLVNRISI